MTKFTEPLSLNSGVLLKNRLMMAPMTVVLSFHNGIVTQEEINYYAERSQGFGAIITAAANVLEMGKGWPGELKVSDDEAIPGLKKLAKAIHEKGAKAILQIFHAGRQSHRSTLLGEQVVSASAVIAEREGAEVPRELSHEEILETIEAFGLATRRAIDAGFDGVEIHGANTYLIQQFFSPHSNRREDEWGGSLEKRYRFIDRVTDRVFEEVANYAKEPFIVGYRFSPEEPETPGIRFEDTLYLVDKLADKDFDYLHVSLGSYKSAAHSPDYADKPRLAYLKEVINNRIQLVGVGGVRKREDVENILATADLVAVGQQILVDPQWVVKLLENRDDEFVDKPFGQAIKEVDIPNPLYNYLKPRY